MPDTAAAPSDLVELGRVVSAYGVKGWVKIQPYSDQAEVLLDTKTWWLKAPQAAVSAGGAFAVPSKVGVLQARRHADTIVALFDNSPDRDVAQTFKSHTVLVPRSQFPALPDNEYYWVDLIGCQVYGRQNNAPVFLGVVNQVSHNGAHAILQVARAKLAADGSTQALYDNKGRALEVLLPFVEAHVHKVDLPGRLIDSNWPADF